MNLYTTEIMAIDPKDGELKKWYGPYVPGISFADARWYCDNNGLGYCEVIGELISEIENGKINNRINYDAKNN